jgi:hypothetical protein
MSAKNGQVFLSYSVSDSRFALALSKALEKRGVKVWFAGTPQPGILFERQLRKALKTAAWHVVLASDDALTSPWVNFELGAAVGQGKRVLPVFLSEAARRDAHSPLTKLKSIMAQGMSAGDVAERVLEVMEQDAEQAA